MKGKRTPKEKKTKSKRMILKQAVSGESNIQKMSTYRVLLFKFFILARFLRSTHFRVLSPKPSKNLTFPHEIASTLKVEHLKRRN